MATSRAPRNSRGGAAGLVAALVAAGLAAAGYLFLGDLHLNLSDEGYLWYGTLRVLEGQVPIRDFQAYDPGRYYWCALGALLWGRGILGLRLSAALFQAVGLFAGLLVVRRVAARRWMLLPAGLVLAAWMFPRHKFFDAGLAMIAVYVALRLFERPDRRMHFVGGLYVGLAGFIGRNHALYAGAGLLLLILLRQLKLREGDLARRLGAWAAGLLVGLAPMIFMALFVPGFFAAWIESVRAHLVQGTDLPLPYPWPWRMDYAGLAWDGWLSQVGLAVSFALPALVYPLGLVFAAIGRREAWRRGSVLICAAAIGVFYAHHAAVRSDALHIAQCIHPMLLGLFALPVALGRPRGRPWQWTIWVLFGAITCFAVLKVHPLLRDGGFRRAGLVPYDVAGDTLLVDPESAAYYDSLKTVVGRYVTDETMFIAPVYPGLYPLLGKTAACREIYFFWPEAEPAVQRRIIDEFEAHRLRWALIIVASVDRREDLFFGRSYPLVWDYFKERFTPVPTPELPSNHLLLRRREAEVIPR